MGRPKAGLEWHGSTLLQRAVGIAARAVDGPVMVVRAPDQRLPLLPPRVQVVDDPVAGRGPLQGIATGLAAAARHATVAAVCAVDLPHMHPAFLRRVLRELRADAALDVALPVARGHAQPLAAAYRTGLASRVAALLDDGTLRTQTLLERCRVQRLDEAALLGDAELAAVDPRLESLINVNTPAEYQEARGRLAPTVAVRCFGALATGVDQGPRTIRAATLRAAASAVGLALDGSVIAVVEEASWIDGRTAGLRTTDPELPLLVGDSVAFLPAGEHC
jgi:molybdopterin-guanine dinucleotide biosynthesis protein A